LGNKHSHLAKIIFPDDDPSASSKGDPTNDRIRRSTIVAADEIMNSAVIKRALSDQNKVHMALLNTP